jgi:hypothetical protein
MPVHLTDYCPAQSKGSPDSEAGRSTLMQLCYTSKVECMRTSPLGLLLGEITMAMGGPLSVPGEAIAIFGVKPDVIQLSPFGKWKVCHQKSVIRSTGCIRQTDGNGERQSRKTDQICLQSKHSATRVYFVLRGPEAGLKGKSTHRAIYSI